MIRKDTYDQCCPYVAEMFVWDWDGHVLNDVRKVIDSHKNTYCVFIYNSMVSCQKGPTHNA